MILVLGAGYVGAKVAELALALQGYKQFLKLVPADPIAPQVKAKVTSLTKTIKDAAKNAATSTTPTTTTP